MFVDEIVPDNVIDRVPVCVNEREYEEVNVFDIVFEEDAVIDIVCDGDAVFDTVVVPLTDTVLDDVIVTDIVDEKVNVGVNDTDAVDVEDMVCDIERDIVDDIVLVMVCEDEAVFEMVCEGDTFY